MTLKDTSIIIRGCRGLDELAACVQLQSEVWGFGDGDLVPRRVFVVALKIGGQVMGAFDTGLPGESPQGSASGLVGFAMALPGLREGRPYLHSHMLAVRDQYRNRGIGRKLKLFQREEALARGIVRMEWTFDPLEIKNSFLNFVRLGVIVRRYSHNLYGVSSSRLQGTIPTDRLCAEWWLESPRVNARLRGETVVLPAVEQTILIPREIDQWRHSLKEQERVLWIQAENRRQFEQAFSRGLAAIDFQIDTEGNGVFQLGRWKEPAGSTNSSQSKPAGIDED